MNGYSDDLIKITKNMLHLDIHYRVGIKDILVYIYHIQEFIRTKKKSK